MILELHFDGNELYIFTVYLKRIKTQGSIVVTC